MPAGQSEGLSGENEIVLTEKEGVVAPFLIGFSLACFGTYLEIQIDSFYKFSMWGMGMFYPR